MSARREPDPLGEQELDLAGWGQAIARRWWLPLAGLVAGVALAFALAAGGSDVFRATALVYVGAPIGPSGGQLVTFGTDPVSVREIATADAVVRRAARAAGARPAEIRAGLAVQPVAGTGKAARILLMNVTVRADSRRKAAAAANEIARVVVAETSEPVLRKIRVLEREIEQGRRELAQTERRIEAAEAALAQPGLSPTDRLIVLTTLGLAEQRRTTVQEDVLEREQQVATAEEVERASVVKPAIATKVTAQSRRNSLVVAGVLGLLLGTLAAIVAPRFARDGQPAAR